MRLDSARDLKQAMLSRLVVPLAAAANARAAMATTRRDGGRVARAAGGIVLAQDASDLFAMSAQSLDEVSVLQRTIALGITSSGKRGQFKLAVRVQRPALLSSPQVDELTKQARGEVDVRLVGRIVKRATTKKRAPRKRAVPWYRASCRPLQIGASVGHVQVTAGTLGCFVQDRHRRTLLLSNNHVLANEDDCATGDVILQPGVYDGGRKSRSRVGALVRWEKLKRRSPNLVDAAVASIDDGIDHDAASLRGIGAPRTSLAGTSPVDVLDEGILVHKIGRTTGVTAGRVTAFELDNVIVAYDAGNLRFDGQIEIEGIGNAPFSDGGDSGSLIVDDDSRALALLFAGGDVGGSNGLGLTYANLFEDVLARLKVSLLY